MTNGKWLAEITMNKFSYNDFPRRCSMDEYHETVKKIAEYYGNLKGLHAIYQLGSVSALGLSDLDIILIFANTIPVNYQNYRHLLSEKQQYIAGHTSPFLLSKKIFSNLPVMFFPSALQFLGGEEQAINLFSQEETKVFRLCYSIDAAISELLWLLDRLTLGTIPIRAMLCHLFSVKYDIKSLLDITGVQHTDGRGFVQQIENLRLNWFDLTEGDTHSQIVYLGSKASKILLDIIIGLGNYFSKNYFKNDSLSSFYFTDLNSIIYFTSNGKIDIRQYKFFQHNRFFNSYFLTLTIGAGIPLLLYSEHNSEAGWRLRRHLMTDNGNSEIIQNCDERLTSAITKKMRILSEYWLFLNKAGPAMSFFEGPWWNNSRLYKIKHFFWKLLLS